VNLPSYFTERIIPEPMSGCWLWVGSYRSNGYGCGFVDGDRVQAHRYVLELGLERKILPGKYALHRCDNRSCVNPAHLYEGTGTENNMDAYRRNRRFPARLRGNTNPAVKITAHEAVCIRKFRNVPSIVWAEVFGITQSAVRKVRSGINWKCLPQL